MRLCYLMLTFILVGCGANNSLSPDESLVKFHKIIEEHTITKNSNSYTLTAQLLPNSYLALKEWRSNNFKEIGSYDSLLNTYGDAIYFTLNIAPDSKNRFGDIMRQNISTYEDYRVRVKDLAFRMDQMLLLKFGGQSIRPYLTSMERVFEVKEDRTFNLAFVIEDTDHMTEFNSSEKIELIFDDEIFETGISHFYFNKINSNELPQIKI